MHIDMLFCDLTTVMSPGLREFFPSMEERAALARG